MDPVKKNKDSVTGNIESNIFAVISHDLRSPFNTILGYCELLTLSIRDNEPEKAIKYIQTIHDAAQKTLGLLNALLDWGRLQQGQLKYSPELFVCEGILEEIIRFIDFQAQSKHIKLKSKVEPGLMVYGDINMVRTIMINLITNGIKFSRTGGKISISAKNISRGVKFEVADNGTGILKEDLATLFSNSPVTCEGTNMEQGMGLGLCLCKNFIDLHGGKIWVESKPGLGSKFKFILPPKNTA